MAAGDGRRALGSTITSDVPIDGNSIGVIIDVILLDPHGYVGRYVLWDKPPISTPEAELTAAPVVLAMQEELGENRVVGVEVWHLRSRSAFFVSREQAIQRLEEVAAIVNSFLAD
jgi:hypothetical protein